MWVDSNIWQAVCCVRRNERKAGRLATDALLGLGFRKWVWAGLGSGPERNYILAERCAGVRGVGGALGTLIPPSSKDCSFRLNPKRCMVVPRDGCDASARRECVMEVAKREF